MLELCLVKVFEMFLHITFENVYFSFGYLHSLMGTIQQGAYYLTRLFPQGWFIMLMVHNGSFLKYE